jgi:hypothetical protein
MSSTAVEPTLERRPTIIRSRASRLRFHAEQHSEHGEVIRDIIIGFADGLTVPFALTAGLSSYIAHVLPIIPLAYTEILVSAPLDSSSLVVWRSSSAARSPWDLVPISHQ